MREEDLPQVLDIDHEAFSTQWPPVTYATLKQELRNRMAYYVVLCHGQAVPPAPPSHTPPGFRQRLMNLFSRAGNRSVPAAATFRLDNIIGFAGIWKIYDEAHIISIAVRKECRRQGLGELLLIAVNHMALLLEARVVTLEVRVSNKEAQALYVKYGFRTAGVRHRYYSDNNEDALIMTTPGINTDEFRGGYQRLRDAHLERWPDLWPQ
jgi:ribosomal-protein-alanine N-acetyltransferase